MDVSYEYLCFDEESGKYHFCKRNQADFIILPMGEYMELENMKGKEDSHVLIPKSEYNGLLKSVKMVHDKAIQKMSDNEKKVADNGYKFLGAEEYYVYSGGSEKYKLWKVTKQTPYSINLNSGDIFEQIKSDLELICGYHILAEDKEVDLSSFMTEEEIEENGDECYSMWNSISKNLLLSDYWDYRKKGYIESSFLNEIQITAKKRFFDNYIKKYIYDFTGLSLGNKFYKISYLVLDLDV